MIRPMAALNRPWSLPDNMVVPREFNLSSRKKRPSDGCGSSGAHRTNGKRGPRHSPCCRTPRKTLHECEFIVGSRAFMEESSTTSCLRPSSYQPQRLILVERNRKHTIPPLNGVGSPSFVTTQAIGVGVVDEAFRLRIERDLTPQLPADGGGEAGHLPVTDDARVAQPCQGSRVG